jgi:hypothetical protein
VCEESAEDGDTDKPTMIQNEINDVINQNFCIEDETPFNVE